jgi:hypothetical protein
MRLQMRRRGIVPLAFAVLLTVAAGLSLAEEHAWVPAAPEGAATPSDLSKGAGPATGIRNHARAHSHATAHGHAGVPPKPGVGSRALTGHQVQEPAADARTRN